jgi:hypothetical protein
MMTIQDQDPLKGDDPLHNSQINYSINDRLTRQSYYGFTHLSIISNYFSARGEVPLTRSK